MQLLRGVGRRVVAVHRAVFAGVVWSAVAGGAMGQTPSLLVSTETDAEAADGRSGVFHDEDILIMNPSAEGSSAAPFITYQNFRVIIGDGDGDGLLDDEPSELDALAVGLDSPDRPSAFDLLVSFSADVKFPSGQKARDGDVIRMLPGGGFDLVISEGAFQDATSTTTIDVDAFAIGLDGTRYFSFAEDEETSASYLINENGGNPILDESTVFQWVPSSLQAHILFVKDAIVSMVNNALGSSLTTVGDLQGLDLDPENPGDFLFAVSSKSKRAEGTVFSSARGGSVAMLGGIELRGETLGFTEPESLDSLAIVRGQKAPLAIRVDSTEVSVSGQSFLDVPISRGTPGGEVVVLASPAVLPASLPVRVRRLSGTGMIYLDTRSSMFDASRRLPKYRARLDGRGDGWMRFSTAGIPEGVQRLLQAVDLESLEASEALSVLTVP